MRRFPLYLVLVLFLGACGGLGLTGFDDVEPGMHFNDVVGLMGKPTAVRVDPDHSAYRRYEWEKGQPPVYYIKVRRIDGVVVAKGMQWPLIVEEVE